MLVDLSFNPGVEANLLTSSAVGELNYDSTVSGSYRRMIERAIAGIRPEARAMIDRIAPRTTIRVGEMRPGIAGFAQWDRDKDFFTVTLDLNHIYRELGQRGVNRLILHELGHVVDYALTTPELDAVLDAEIPTGYGCDNGVSGSCADKRERFAESFSKWATGDIGAQAGLVLGYRIPPPNDIEAWGAQLVAGVKAN